LDDYSFGRGHPERRIDYNHRAIHETAVTAKAVIRSFYSALPKYSYFWGRSIGGVQGLVEAQRYPSDYDGVLAASPVIDRALTWEGWAWVAQAFDGSGSQIPENKLLAIQAAVVKACDSRDGLQDGIISEPTNCQFDPNTLLCKGSDAGQCLTEPQVMALQKYYAGPHDAKGEQIAPTFPPGAEACLANSMTCAGVAARRASNWVDGLVTNHWDVRTFSFERDGVAFNNDPDIREGNDADPNLRAFMRRGGKLILEHGWSDGTAIPMQTVTYFERVIATMGEKAADRFVRLYMIPGMAHSGASALPGAPTGPGLNRFHALQRWVEAGENPGPILATRYVVDEKPESGIVRTRPLCPYPQGSVYNGRGSADEARNFSCKVQVRLHTQYKQPRLAGY
jgi:feruloyl esterase